MSTPMRQLSRCLLLTALLAFSAVAAEPYQVRDDFSSYAEGGYGEPRWDAQHIGFQVHDQAFQAIVPRGRGIALLKEAPCGQTIVCEASVTCAETLGDSWKTVGIGIYLDDLNFWHLALAEGPDRSRRFAELSEMLAGVWNAQHEPGSRLKTVEETGPFAWEPGHTYRLRLKMENAESERRLTGEIFDGAELRYRCVRVLAGQVVDRGRPMLTATSVAARFDDVSVSVADPVVEATIEREYPPFASSLTFGEPGQGRGFFHTAIAGDRWWLIDPHGRQTLSIGTDHVGYHGHWCESLGYAPYHRRVVEKFGDIDAWARETTRRLRAWNFNVVGAGSSPEA
ncbi:MAG: hypothetical protein KDA42_13410, partial [Planctomycetales bacterium]|nr:hypothetical protein [Planctomycetales bacterium]